MTDRNVLETCPESSRSVYRGMAGRIGRSKKAAIRLKCLECCAWQAAEVKRCQIVNCALWGLGGQAAAPEAP